MANRNKRMQRRPGNLGSMAVISFVVIAIMVVILIQESALKEKMAGLEKREQYLISQIEEQNRRSEEIEEYRKYTQTKKYVEDMAKARLGLVYKDEIIFETE